MSIIRKLWAFCRKVLATGLVGLALGLANLCVAVAGPVEPGAHITADPMRHYPPADTDGKAPDVAACATACLSPLLVPPAVLTAVRASAVALHPAAEPAMQGVPPELDEPPPR